MSDLSDRALAIAVGQVGSTEKPLKSNWGRPVQDYLSSVGIFFPASWCMAFVYYCFSQAGEQLGLENPLKKTGGVLPQWFAEKDAHGITTGLKPGDIMIMDHGHGLGHTGIVESVDPDGTINTIEGNTNDTGSREGVEVLRKKRLNKPPVVGFLRF